MRLQLLRNATMRIQYHGHTILTDPMLSDRGEIRSFAGIEKNPIVDLPLPVAEILNGIDALMVSHLHPDHFDAKAAALLPREIPLFCRPGDEEKLAAEGFADVRPVNDSLAWEGLTLVQTGGLHGSGAILERMGPVCGFVLRAEDEPTVYWAGDTILCDPVRDAIDRYHPDVILTHSGGATIPGFDPILMNAEQTLALANLAPWATIVAIHLEALDHCTVPRTRLREMANAAGIDENRLRIPENGEWVLL